MNLIRKDGVATFEGSPKSVAEFWRRVREFFADPANEEERLTPEEMLDKFDPDKVTVQ